MAQAMVTVDYVHADSNRADVFTMVVPSDFGACLTKIRMGE